MFSAVLKMTLRALDYAVCIYTKRTEKAEINPTQILQPNIPHALQENISSPPQPFVKMIFETISYRRVQFKAYIHSYHVSEQMNKKIDRH